MAILNVNASRMELNKLKHKLTTTRKGHKLLKNKSDGLLREFLILCKKTIKLKKDINIKINTANICLTKAKISDSSQSVKTSCMTSKNNISVKINNSNILGVTLPCFIPEKKTTVKNLPNYSFFSNSIFVDKATKNYTEILINLIELAEKEKAIFILSKEIEKTRRKVNALEHILIPNLEDTIKFISLKLEENERDTIAALSRIK